MIALFLQKTETKPSMQHKTWLDSSFIINLMYIVDGSWMCIDYWVLRLKNVSHTMKEQLQEMDGHIWVEDGSPHTTQKWCLHHGTLLQIPKIFLKKLILANKYWYCLSLQVLTVTKLAFINRVYKYYQIMAGTIIIVMTKLQSLSKVHCATFQKQKCHHTSG